MKNLLKPLSAILVVLPFVLSSCGEDTPVPTIDFTYEADGHDVTFTATATDADTYSWNFGDDETSTEMNPVHTYAAAGDYQVTCSVSGEGGDNSVTKTVTVPETEADYIVGTWKLSTTDTVYIYNLDYTLDDKQPAGIFQLLGLGSIFDDEFTFNADGTMTIDNKDGMSFAVLTNAAIILSTFSEEAFIQAMEDGRLKLPIDPQTGDTLTDFGVGDVEYTIPADGTWALTTDDLVVPGPDGDVTLTGKHFTFAEGYYLGLFNLKTEAILKEVTADKLVVQVLINGDLSVEGLNTVTNLGEFTLVHP